MVASLPTASPEQVRRQQLAGQPVTLIDVRTPAEYAAVHAEGAELVTLDGFKPADALARRREPGAPIYVICKSGARATKAVEQLRSAGAEQVYCVDGGTDAWVAAGLPVVRGQPTVISLERQVRIGAGLLVLAGVGLGVFVHPVGFGLAALVGAGLVFAGVTDWCGMGMLLAKLPWNRG